MIIIMVFIIIMLFSFLLLINFIVIIIIIIIIIIMIMVMIIIAIIVMLLLLLLLLLLMMMMIIIILFLFLLFLLLSLLLTLHPHRIPFLFTHQHNPSGFHMGRRHRHAASLLQNGRGVYAAISTFYNRFRALNAVFHRHIQSGSRFCRQQDRLRQQRPCHSHYRLVLGPGDAICIVMTCSVTTLVAVWAHSRHPVQFAELT
jgi:hypothetical protein